MAELEDPSTEQNCSALENVDAAKAAKRLIVALAYEAGVNVKAISSRDGIPQSAVYWLDSFEDNRSRTRSNTNPSQNDYPKSLLSSESATRSALQTLSSHQSGVFEVKIPTAYSN